MALTSDVHKQIGFRVKPTFGADPELFIAVNGQVVGAEKIIPKEGLSAGPQERPGFGGNNKIELDGVQVELHPEARNCRALLANDFKVIFKKLKEQLKAKGATASFATVVKLDPAEMKTLSDAAKKLGCAPSSNVYDPTATVKVPKNFRERSAGGHIHTSLAGALHRDNSGYNLRALTTEEVVELVQLYDCCVGLPAVFVDRDPAQARRRRVYGRASEHRVKPYGFEYRTLSNFWLRSYPLMSMTFGLCRMACNIWYAKYNGYPYNSNTYPKWDASGELLKRVNLKRVAEAINKNDPELAMKQWKIVEAFIDEFYKEPSSGLSTGEPLVNFRHFCKQIERKGIEYWFPENPVDHWASLLEGHQINGDGYAGWETFLATAVEEDRVSSSIDAFLDDLRKRSVA